MIRFFVVNGCDGTLIGSKDAFGNGGTLFRTSFWLKGAANSLSLIDCGAGSFPALKAKGWSPADTNSVVLTHLHGDHFGGLPFLVLDGQSRRRQRALTIAARKARASACWPPWICCSRIGSRVPLKCSEETAAAHRHSLVSGGTSNRRHLCDGPARRRL